MSNLLAKARETEEETSNMLKKAKESRKFDSQYAEK
jgi:hypothetical protein